MDMTPKTNNKKQSKYRIMSHSPLPNKKQNLKKKEENYEKEINILMVSKYIAMSTMNYIEIESEKCLNQSDNKLKIGVPKRRLKLSSDNNLKLKCFSKNNLKQNLANYESEVKIDPKYDSNTGCKVNKLKNDFSYFKKSFMQSLEK